MKLHKMEYDYNGKISLKLAKQDLEQAEEEEIPIEERLTTYIYENLMGRESTFKGPFGRKQVVYADLISTGRSLRFLEHFMMNEVLPALSDSEAMTTVTGLQSMLYLDETRYVKSIYAKKLEYCNHCDSSIGHFKMLLMTNIY